MIKPHKIHHFSLVKSVKNHQVSWPKSVPESCLQLGTLLSQSNVLVAQSADCVLTERADVSVISSFVKPSLNGDIKGYLYSAIDWVYI